MKFESNYLFVYGTLCQRARNSAFEIFSDDVVFVDHAYLQAKMYLVAHYPGIVDSTAKQDVVRGELYEAVNPIRLFERLDDYECCTDAYPEPKQYERVVRNVRTQGEINYSACLYLFKLPTEKLLRIDSGDFRLFQDQTEYL